jgi:hypothetical protein
VPLTRRIRRAFQTKPVDDGVLYLHLGILHKIRPPGFFCCMSEIRTISGAKPWANSKRARVAIPAVVRRLSARYKNSRASTRRKTIKEVARLATKAKSEAARVASIRELLDRAYGKPAQQGAMGFVIDPVHP